MAALISAVISALVGSDDVMVWVLLEVCVNG
jgi:hypothetical protein